jgi:hypothetical protein
MKLHTKLSTQDVYDALIVTHARGLMTTDVHFVQFIEEPSKSRPNGYKLQLGTRDQHSGPKNSRYYKNTGKRGAHSERNEGDPVWAATYDEWGWFIADIFDRDPEASFGHYKTKALFEQMTKGKYKLENLNPTGVWVNTLHP